MVSCASSSTLSIGEAVLEGLTSADHFSVDGTLIQSFASMKSLHPTDTKVSDGSDDDAPHNPSISFCKFRKEKRGNKTHRSIVDPEARLMRKGDGKPALLSHSGHVLMENRHGLCLDIAVDEANGYAERISSGAMLDHVRRRHGLWPRTLGADGGYKDGTYLDALEQFGIVPHVPVGDGPIRGAGSEARRRAKRRKRTKGYQWSQRIRKRAEEIFGWCKTVGGLARSRFVGRWKLKQQSEITAAAYNLLRLAKPPPNWLHWISDER